MEQAPSWNDDSPSAGQKILSLKNPNGYFNQVFVCLPTGQ
jgi:hypothetical protein